MANIEDPDQTAPEIGLILQEQSDLLFFYIVCLVI